MNPRVIGLFAAVGGLLALGLSLVIDQGTIVVAHIGVFSLLVIVLVGIADSKSTQMQGCQTILALIFVPFAGTVMAGLARLAQFPLLDPLVAWAGAFRFAAMCVFAGFATALFVRLRARFGDEKRRSREKPAMIVLTAVLSGLMIGLVGLAWDLIGLGIRQF